MIRLFGILNICHSIVIRSQRSQNDLILKWPDEQPNNSVGSMGISFGPSQVREIALGLEHSGVRKLTVQRKKRYQRVFRMDGILF